MFKHATPACAVAAAITLSLSAQAQSVPGAPIVVPQDNSTVIIEFVSFEAAYTGQLSFLGGGTDLQVTQPAADTGLPGFGQATFINQLGSADVIILQGTYNTGDVLHFAYRVTDPVEAIDTLRTDTAGDTAQYSWDAAMGLLSIEDLRPDNPWYDADYNDIIVRVTFSNVPGPGAAMVTAFGSLLLGGRRRRTA
jgi:hypothetical protein